MPNNPGAGAAVCPFYRTEDNRSVHCEGFQDESSVILWFRYNDQLLDWLNLRCRSFSYTECPIAKQLLAKYEEDGK